MTKMTPKKVNPRDLPSLNAASFDERVADHLRRFLADKDAFAKNTWDQMLSVLRSWARWCDERGKVWLPADYDDVRDYLFYLKEELGRATSTVAQHKTMINKIHAEAGLLRPDDVRSVDRGMRKIRRTSVLKGEMIGQAIPLHREELLKVAAAWESNTRLYQRRNLAFIGISYITLLRIAEISRLRVRDVTFSPDGTAILLVKHTKTIIDGYGVIKKLAPIVTEWLVNWLEMSGLADQPDAFVFCGVDRYNKLRQTKNPLTHRAIEKIFSDAWSALYGTQDGKSTKRYRTWTGHSPRVGAAQDMAKSGASLPQIMHEGTWKTPKQVMGYIRHLEADNSIMLRMFR
ncbi:tyrosine-type recombinase/integrase [Nissabacter sp. SGAir0207]|uniref:tyrosine-type recombinase/integrase n=1 Tax=Nissabacter sp. SGAir0207 TaxID=2126321 RepID=UPI00143DD0B3|nr:tyrosine-type recombinase/integrase [Nissabacter sp. SGAir0207]